MNGEEYRVRIVAREKEKSDTLYIVETEILPLKDGVRMAAGQMPPTLGATPSTITIPDLIKDVKIYNYDTQENQEYTPEDIRYHLSKRGENITPVKGWGFYGEEIFVKNRKTGDDIAPIREDILPEVESKTENVAPITEDIAPIREDIKPKVSEMSGDIAPVREDIEEKQVKASESNMHENDIEYQKLQKKKEAAWAELGELPEYISKRAEELYKELQGMKKGARVSRAVSYTHLTLPTT